jgi:hypothetical protein
MTRRRRGRRRKAGRGGSGAAGRILGFVAAAATVLAVGVGLSTGSSAEIDSTNDPSSWVGGRVRVEVLNGGGVPGMARAATERLREAGFDVVAFGNASSFESDRPSAVIDRVGRTDVARAVAAALGIDNVKSEPDPNLFVEVTVVVGGAWTPDSALAPEDTTTVRPAWDPRGWFEG